MNLQLVSFIFLLPLLFSMLFVADANGLTATLRCSPGYSATGTYSLSEGGDTISGPHTQSCPPTSRIPDLPDSADDLSIISYTVIAPDGTVTGNPPDMSPYQNLPFFNHPDAPNSYVCNASGCVADPAAPAFLQAGEFLLAGYRDGSTSTLTVNILDVQTRQKISGALVTAVDSANNVSFTSSTTNSDGKTVLTLNNGGEYYLKVESSSYLPQASDTFLIANNHEWTMVLSPSVPTGGTDSIALWIGIGIAIGIGIGVGIILMIRRTP